MEKLIFALPILYGLIHLMEYMSYFARVSGWLMGYKLLGYSIQQMFFVVTRFAFIAFMPILGFIVDNKINKHVFINIMQASLLCASFMYCLVFLFRTRIINLISNYIIKMNKGIKDIKHKNYNSDINISSVIKYKKYIFFSMIVFSCYSLGVFVAFYFSILYYDYRVTISQLSGIINGLATVLLTFVIEPKISYFFDEDNPDVLSIFYALLLGRLLAVLVLSQVIVFLLSMFY